MYLVTQLLKQQEHLCIVQNVYWQHLLHIFYDICTSEIKALGKVFPYAIFNTWNYVNSRYFIVLSNQH